MPEAWQLIPVYFVLALAIVNYAGAFAGASPLKIPVFFEEGYCFPDLDYVSLFEQGSDFICLLRLN